MQRLCGEWFLGNFEDLKEGHITGGRMGRKCMVRLEVGEVGRSQVAAAAAKSLQSCPTVRPHGQQPTRLLCPWNSLGKSNGVGCHFLLWEPS